MRGGGYYNATIMGAYNVIFFSASRKSASYSPLFIKGTKSDAYKFDADIRLLNMGTFNAAISLKHPRRTIGYWGVGVIKNHMLARVGMRNP